MADDRVRFCRAGAASRKPKARKLGRVAALLGSVALSGGPKRVSAVLSPLPFREHRLWPTPSLPSERTNPSSSALFIANATDPDTEVQKLLVEAINDFFAKNGLPRFDDI